jgi:hypothetical protein
LRFHFRKDITAMNLALNVMDLKIKHSVDMDVVPSQTLFPSPQR